MGIAEHRVIMVTIYAKLFKYFSGFKVMMERTRNVDFLTYDL